MTTGDIRCNGKAVKYWLMVSWKPWLPYKTLFVVTNHVIQDLYICATYLRSKNFFHCKNTFFVLAFWTNLVSIRYYTKWHALQSFTGRRQQITICKLEQQFCWKVKIWKYIYSCIATYLKCLSLELYSPHFVKEVSLKQLLNKSQCMTVLPITGFY